MISDREIWIIANPVYYYYYYFIVSTVVPESYRDYDSKFMNSHLRGLAPHHGLTIALLISFQARRRSLAGSLDKCS